MTATMPLQLSIGLAVSLLNISCHFGRCISAKGVVETRSISVEPFQSLITEGPMDIKVTPGAEYGVQVEGPSSWSEMVQADVLGGVLTISMEGCLSGHGKLIVHVTTPSLDAVKLRGSGDVKGAIPSSSDAVLVELHGSGDMELEIASASVTADLRGSGNMVLKGTTGSLLARLHGSGDIRAAGLETEEAVAEVRGSGDIVVNAHGTLSASVHGSGDIRYHGDPHVAKREVHGSGDIRQAK